MAMETKQLHNLSKIYNERIAEGKENIDEALPAIAGLALKAGAAAGAGYLANKGLQAVKKKVDSALTGATKKGNVGGIKVGGSAKHTGSIGSGSFKTESYYNWRQDLKEIPDYEQIPASSKKRNEKISEKNVKNTIKINPEMKEEVVDENLIKFIKNPKATIQKAVDKKLTSATKKGSIGGIKVGGSASKLGSIGSGPLNTEGKRWQDDDGDGKWYEKSDVDGKISKREKKAKNHNCASKVKHEQFGVGDCISEAHDLDENGNVAHYDVEFEEYIVKGVPVEELEILEGHMHEHVIREKEESKIKNCGCGQNPCVTYGKQEDIKTESYEKKKTGEVLSAFKRDPKVRKRFEKAAKKEGGPGSAKNRAADDMLQTAKNTAKRKGDTSKSDDRYAYESKLWDEFAEGYQRNPERDTRSAREKRMDDPDRGINSPAFRAFMAAQEGRSKKSVDKKKKVKS